MTYRYQSLAICLLSSSILLAQSSTDPWEGSLQSIGTSATLRTDAVRCLASSVYTLSRRYHLRTGYEDAPLEFASDLVDVTAPDRTSGLHVFLPRGGSLTFTFSIDPVKHEPAAVQSALQNMLDAYDRIGYPGTYSLNIETHWLNIIPIKSRTRFGNLKPLSPVLNAEITIPHDRPITLATAITSVLEAVSASTGTKSILGRRLPNQWASTPFIGSPNQQSARELLESIFDASGSPISWVLLYDPTFHYYVFTPYGT